MKTKGYAADRIPSDRQIFIDELAGNATNDREHMMEKQIQQADGKLTKAQYEQYFRSLPEPVQTKLTEDSSSAPGEVFCNDDFLLIPGTLNRNVFITVQPPRGFSKDSAKIYHSPDVCRPIILGLLCLVARCVEA